jgi:uncharacterized protein involved in type VI secretion and phage assembly
MNANTIVSHPAGRIALAALAAVATAFALLAAVPAPDTAPPAHGLLRHRALAATASGDPDRPIILGTVPNPSTHGGGANEIRLDESPGNPRAFPASRHEPVTVILTRTHSAAKGGNAVAIETLTIEHEGIRPSVAQQGRVSLDADANEAAPRAPLAPYEYPGDYAQRYDGVSVAAAGGFKSVSGLKFESEVVE